MRLPHRPLVAMVALVAVAAAACGGDARDPLASTSTTSTTRGDAVGEPTGFVVIGDFGGGPAQGAVARAMEVWARAHPVDAIVTTGDNVYDHGEPEHFADQLDAPYRALRDTSPLWVTLGNHDVSKGFGGEQLEHLGLPALPYARELPGVQLLFLDGNRPNDAQAEWLDARLSEPGPPFRVVSFHQPAYSCGLHGPTGGVLSNWVPVLERHQVALVLSGHDHLYQRFTTDAGVTYVVTGGGGRGLYEFREPCRFEGILDTYAERHHFVGVEVADGVMTASAVADDGEILDRFELRR